MYCSRCGAENGAAAVFCSACGSSIVAAPAPAAPEKPHLIYRTWFIVLLLVVFAPAGIVLLWLQKPRSPFLGGTAVRAALSVFFGLVWLVAITSSRDHSGTAPSQRAAADASQAVESRRKAAAEPAPAAPSGVRVGDRFTLGDFAYVIEGASSSRRLGNQFVSEQAEDGAMFVVVSYAMENLSSETQTVLADDMKLVDGRGRKFRPSARANTALTMTSGGKDFLASELQPGLRRKMQTAFEVPGDVAAAPFTLEVPEKGLLGNKTVAVAVHVQQ